MCLVFGQESISCCWTGPLASCLTKKKIPIVDQLRTNSIPMFTTLHMYMYQLCTNFVPTLYNLRTKLFILISTIYQFRTKVRGVNDTTGFHSQPSNNDLGKTWGLPWISGVTDTLNIQGIGDPGSLTLGYPGYTGYRLPRISRGTRYPGYPRVTVTPKIQGHLKLKFQGNRYPGFSRERLPWISGVTVTLNIQGNNYPEYPG